MSRRLMLVLAVCEGGKKILYRRTTGTRIVEELDKTPSSSQGDGSSSDDGCRVFKKRPAP